MRLDCSANWVRFSYPDSIRYYVNKCREAGMTALVLDVKGTSSEVVYPSEHAPQVREWKGFVRPDFDFVVLSSKLRTMPDWRFTVRSTPLPKAMAYSVAD